MIAVTKRGLCAEIFAEGSVLHAITCQIHCGTIQTMAYSLQPGPLPFKRTLVPLFDFSWTKHLCSPTGYVRAQLPTYNIQHRQPMPFKPRRTNGNRGVVCAANPQSKICNVVRFVASLRQGAGMRQGILAHLIAMDIDKHVAADLLHLSHHVEHLDARKIDVCIVAGVTIQLSPKTQDVQIANRMTE